MKIIVLHGEDLQKSYERLRKFTDEAKKRNWEILYDTINETSSLFGKERLTVIRDYKLFTKKTFDGTLVIYHEGTLPALFLKSLPKETKIEEYKLSVLIWKFLEGLSPGNSTNSLKLLHAILLKEPVEFIFTLIARQFKDLYWVKIDSLSMNIPPWRLSKLNSQASRFSVPRLTEIINLLAKIDVDVKIGQSDLVSSLDLLIIKNLQ